MINEKIVQHRAYQVLSASPASVPLEYDLGKKVGKFRERAAGGLAVLFMELENALIRFVKKMGLKWPNMQ